jgi:hypothetical protein
LNTHLDPIKHIFDKYNQTSLNFSQFKHIIETIATLEHSTNTINEYGITENHILIILEKIRPHLPTNVAKKNITRITNKLFKAIGDESPIEEPSDIIDSHQYTKMQVTTLKKILYKVKYYIQTK